MLQLIPGTTISLAYMTDCSLAALQVQEVRGEKPAHPASLLREAYGLQAEH